MSPKSERTIDTIVNVGDCDRVNSERNNRLRLSMGMKFEMYSLSRLETSRSESPGTRETAIGTHRDLIRTELSDVWRYSPFQSFAPHF